MLSIQHINIHIKAKKIRKQGKAQRVAYPANANVTVHSLLTYLPLSEWRLKISPWSNLAMSTPNHPSTLATSSQALLN